MAWATFITTNKTGATNTSFLRKGRTHAVHVVACKRHMAHETVVLGA